MVLKLKDYANDIIVEQSKPVFVTKQEVDQVYCQILYESFKTNDDKEKFLREQFDAANQELSTILKQYSNEVDKPFLK